LPVGRQNQPQSAERDTSKLALTHLQHDGARV
jgi:hypothetical protein